MSVRSRLWLGVLTLFVVCTFAAPTSQASKNRCDDCGATCIMEYREGWSDCGGSPAGCWRTTVC